MDVTEHLQQVIEHKGQTTIIYNGGSAPGSARAISPIELRGDTLIARCLETNARKSFKLAKVEIATTQPIEPYRPKEDRSSWSFQQHLDDLMPALIAAGWHISTGPDFVEVGRLFKNGKPRKTPDAGLYYTPLTTRRELDWTTKSWVDISEPSTLPWKLVCSGADARSFKLLGRAFSAFTEAAVALQAKLQES